MWRICGAAKSMLREMFKPRVVRRADEALMAADANLEKIERLALRERSGTMALQQQIRRLQTTLEQGRR